MSLIQSVLYRERFHCTKLHAVVAMSLTTSLLIVCLLLHTHRLKLFEFWNEDSRLPSDTLGRLSQLLAVMYSPSTEGQFLSCCMNLMLQLTWRSPDYSRPMFDVPLSECKFQVGLWLVTMAAAYIRMYQSLNCAGVVGVGGVGWMWVCASVCTEYGVCTLFHPPLPAIIPSGTIHRSLLAAATPPDDTSLCSHPGDTAGE